MSSYFFSKTKQKTEKKQKRNRKKGIPGKKAQLTEAAQPRGRPVFFLAPARLLPPWRACRRRLATSCFPKSSSLRHETPTLTCITFPLAARRLPSSFSLFPHR